MKSLLLPRLLRALAIVLAFALPVSSGAQGGDKPFSKEQLDQMTAQVALYPDSLLSQLFMATTYPDEFAAAVKWAKAHPDAKGDDAVKMVENEPWDPSVASLVGFPEVLITLGDKPDWVKNMGDAFLAQPEDVMDSVQRLRAQAEKAGNLKSNEQVKVTTEAAPPSQTTVVQQAAPPPQVIVIEPAQPSVVYVPAYNPAVVYGPWAYPAYPPYYYPPPPGYWWSRTIATGIAWGVGIGVSNALWGGFNWGRGDVNINVNRYNNINVNKRISANGNRANWKHNPEHRGNAAYRGGNATRQQLDSKYKAGTREQYRGKDASRDASRERAAQTMQDRGVKFDQSSARDRAQSMERSGARDRAQTMDRSGGAEPRADHGPVGGAEPRAERGPVGGTRPCAERRSQRRAAAGAVGEPRQRVAWREQSAGQGPGRSRGVESGVGAARERRWRRKGGACRRGWRWRRSCRRRRGWSRRRWWRRTASLRRSTQT